MDPQGGEQSVEKMRQAGNGKGRMYIISNAGHHGEKILIPLLRIITKDVLQVYLDNVKAVNDLMIKELDRPT
jgi:cardiolipin-specific phospholipase